MVVGRSFVLTWQTLCFLAPGFAVAKVEMKEGEVELGTLWRPLGICHRVPQGKVHPIYPGRALAIHGGPAPDWKG